MPEIEQPIEEGDTFTWGVGGRVTVNRIYINEDCNTQVRVTDTRADETQGLTITEEDLCEKIQSGELTRVNQ
jgi:hypothetical protein